MKKLLKRVITLAVVVAMTVTTFVGCASEADNKDVVSKVYGEEIKFGVVNFYARYYQATDWMISMFESYEEDMWSVLQEDGRTLEESVRDSVIETVQNMYILAHHASEYNVTLTDEEVAKIEEVATTFDTANTDGVKGKVSGEKEYVVEFLTKYTYAQKVQDAMLEKYVSEIKDEEVAQKRMRYVSFDTTTESDDGELVDMTAEEIAEAKKQADEFLAGAKANGSMETYGTEKEITTSTLTFDSESTSLDEAVIKAADALEENAFSEVIEAEDGYYVVQLESKLDRDATDAEKDTIADEKLTEQLEAWRKEAKITVDEDVLETISFSKVNVSQKADETEEDTTTEDTTTEDTTTEDTTTEDTTTEDTTTEDTATEDTTTEETTTEETAE